MSARTDSPGLLLRTEADLAHVNFRSAAVVTVIAQDADDGRVLMVAHADLEALTHCLATGEMWYRSRSRGLWHKGATSGNVQRVVELRLDCDGDAVLALVRPAGPACHTGAVSCFGAYATDAIARLDRVIDARALEPAPDASYTAKLLADRNLRMKKIGEEAAEFTVACADGDSDRAVEEAADLVYHAAVALRATGATMGAVRRALASRER